jgi:EAL domain-containing protein (putative c-di-GMP-specific phosphodiesterase class I)
VIEHALRQLVRWRRVRPDVTVSVNLSARQLEDSGLAAMLTKAMDAVHVPPEALCLEISERALTRNRDATRRVFQGLKDVGVTIAIDDFGLGAASLSSLRALPVDSVKIHESFVSDLGTRPEEASVVEAVVKLGHALGLQVVAEGVETDGQLAELRTLGFDAAQGFLLGRPVPQDQAEALLAG